jgi:hypothetical protein
MKLLIHRASILALLAFTLPSCYSYKNISKRKPITREFLSGLEPGKKYQFELLIGETQTIYITAVSGETIHGILYRGGKIVKDKNATLVNPVTGQFEYQDVYVKETQSSYSDSFENVMKNVNRISVRKVDPIKIAALIIVPSSVIFGVWAITNIPFQ